MAHPSKHLLSILSEAESVSTLALGELTQGAYEAIDAAGFEAGALSGNPIAILDKFFREKLIPFLEDRKAEFCELAFGTVALFAEEGFSGPNTAKALIGVGVIDAIQKMLPGGFSGEMDFSVLSNTDWAMLAFGLMVAWDFLKQASND